MRTYDCTDVTDLAPELATGNLCGEERAAAIAHLDSCPCCQHVVNSFTAVTDRLLLLARRVEPPAGFEQRVLAAIPTDLPSRRRPHRSRRTWAALAAAAAALALTFAAGGLLADHGFSGEPAVAAAEMRTADGAVVGEVFLHDDAPASLYMTLPGWAEQVDRYGPPNMRYSVRIETADGRMTSQRIMPRDGASWATTLDVDVDTVTKVAVVDDHGYVWCQAQFG